jgi:hypothetical protein
MQYSVIHHQGGPGYPQTLEADILPLVERGVMGPGGAFDLLQELPGLIRRD